MGRHLLAVVAKLLQLLELSISFPVTTNVGALQKCSYLRRLTLQQVDLKGHNDERETVLPLDLKCMHDLKHLDIIAEFELSAIELFPVLDALETASTCSSYRQLKFCFEEHVVSLHTRLVFFT